MNTIDRPISFDSPLSFCGSIHDSARFAAEVRAERSDPCEDDCEGLTADLERYPTESKLNRRVRRIDGEAKKAWREHRKSNQREFDAALAKARDGRNIDQLIEEAMRVGTFSVTDL